jgi:hypothetical protein
VGQFEVGIHIGQPLSEFLVLLDLLAQALSSRQGFLGSFLILPEIGLGYLFFEGFKFLAALGGVKESSAVRWRVASSRHILFAVRRSRLLLILQRPRAAMYIRCHSDPAVVGEESRSAASPLLAM